MTLHLNNHGGSKDQHTGEDKSDERREEQWRKTTEQSWKMMTAEKTMG
jgi:hypothetical protein